MCRGLRDGSIRMWNRATLEVERTLTGHTGAVLAGCSTSETSSPWHDAPGGGGRRAAVGQWQRLRSSCAWRRMAASPGGGWRRQQSGGGSI